MDLLFHLIVPLAILYFLGIKNRAIFLLLPLAAIFDFTKPFYPRESHSIIILAIILAVIAAFLFFFKIDNKKFILKISAFYMISHLILDLGWYEPFFWPVLKDFYLVNFNVLLKGFIPVINFSISAVQSAPPVPGYPNIFGTESVGLIALMAAIYFYKKIRKNKILK